jgi:hypothetical protein
VVTEAILEGVSIDNVRAAIQAAWLADEDRTAIEIAQRFGLYGVFCLRCADAPTRWTLCVSCARYEIQSLGTRQLRMDRVRAFQQQWSLANPGDQIAVDGIVGLAVMVRGWRPYRKYEAL